MNLDERMNRFALPVRELFNNFFHVAGASSSTSGTPLNEYSADGARELKSAFRTSKRFSLRVWCANRQN